MTTPKTSRFGFGAYFRLAFGALAALIVSCAEDKSSTENTAGGAQMPAGGAFTSGGAGGSSGGAAPSGGVGLSQAGANDASGGTTAPSSGGSSTALGGAASETRGGATSSGGASSDGGKSQSSGGAALGGSSGSGTVPAKPSSGCSATTALQSGRASIDVNGTAREYILKLPQNYSAQHPYRLMFAWHGRKYSAQAVVDGNEPPTGPFFGVESRSEDSVIFVAPQAIDSWAAQTDLPFLDAMLERFKTSLCIDENRVFSMGFSMGAIMTINIACSRTSTFRAVAAMSGSLSGTCSGTQGIGYWASHGESDTTITISNGEAARDEFVRRNHCSAQTKPVPPERCVSYQGCDTGYPVTWCPFDGVHEPPPFSGEGIWGFFRQF